MPTFDCNAEVTVDYEVTDRIEATSAEEADLIFQKRFEAGEYDDQFWGDGNRRDFFNYGAQEDN